MTRSVRESRTSLRSRIVPVCAAIAVLFGVGSELAQAQMRPGATNYNAQVPKEGDRPKPTCVAAQLPARSAVVCNFGNVALSVSYWDSESAWQTVTISSGQQSIVTCAKCERQIDLSFHDGRASRQITLAIGGAYELYWAASGVWDVRASTPAPVMLQGPPKAAVSVQ